MAPSPLPPKIMVSGGKQDAATVAPQCSAGRCRICDLAYDLRLAAIVTLTVRCHRAAWRATGHRSPQPPPALHAPARHRVERSPVLVPYGSTRLIERLS
jgi:hypothetical protein